MYFDSLKFFNKKLISECIKMSEALRVRDVQSFAITVHAVKSTLSTIGAMQLSEMAADLEAAAKEGKIDYSVEHYSPLQEKLYKLHEQLTAIFNDDVSADEKQAGDEAMLRENLAKAIAAAEDFDSDLGTEILEELVKYDFGEKNNAALEDALTAFSDFDCNKAMESLTQLSKNENASLL
jgi:HPt (histidine-containing phosphotransfer) domain-containing protein